MKKFFLIFIPALLIAIIFITASQLIAKYNRQKGALQVTASPESKVYLNGQYIGNTPLCKCESMDMIRAGDYTIRLVPEKGGLSEFQEKIVISPGVLTVVDRKFAKDSLSEGSVIALTPLKDKKKTELLVISLPKESTVFLDNSEIGKTPLIFKDPTVSDHILTIKKTGYKEKVIRIRTPLGYKLTVTAYLSTIDDLSSMTSSPSATTASPTPTPASSMILILETPTGFLRVRDSINGLEVARVTPGEKYELVSEDGNWFEIKLKDGQTGWITSQYAKKLVGAEEINY